MSLVDFIALILASGALVDLWFNSELVATQRATEQAIADGEGPGPRVLLARLLSCFYCLSHHTALWLLTAWGISYWYLRGGLSGWPLDPVATLIYALAATRAALLLNGLLPEDLQYRRDIQLPPPVVPTVRITPGTDSDDQRPNPWPAGPNPWSTGPRS